MPRIYRTQKEVEQLLIPEFVSCLGYSISCPRWQERPDALLTVSARNEWKRIAVEHTGYFNDTLAGQESPITQIDDFWRLVQASIVRRISHRKHLTGIVGTVRLRKHFRKPPNSVGLARQLAAELVAFAEAHGVRKSEHIPFDHWQFNGYPTLDSLLSELLLSRWTDDPVRVFRCSWICSNITDGGICVNLEYIKSAIAKKNRKAANYENWGDAGEKWLLIAADGANLCNHAGPSIQNVNWDDAELLELCRTSPFDGIVFWERIRCWYKWLKPNKPVKQCRNPYAD